MNENIIKKQSRTDWARLEKMTDEDIDYSDIPPLTEQFFQRARLYVPSRAVVLDSDLIAWFQSQESNYQVAINQILRHYMQQRQSNIRVTSL